MSRPGPRPTIPHAVDPTTMDEPPATPSDKGSQSSGSPPEIDQILDHGEAVLTATMNWMQLTTLIPTPIDPRVGRADKFRRDYIQWWVQTLQNEPFHGEWKAEYLAEYVMVHVDMMQVQRNMQYAPVDLLRAMINFHLHMKSLSYLEGFVPLESDRVKLWEDIYWLMNDNFRDLFGDWSTDKENGEIKPVGEFLAKVHEVTERNNLRNKVLVVMQSLDSPRWANQNFMPETVAPTRPSGWAQGQDSDSDDDDDEEDDEESEEEGEAMDID